MKKLVMIIGLTAGIFFLAAQTQAQTTQSPDKSATVQTQQTTPAPAGTFVDKNGDGICDNHQQQGKNAQCTGFVDKNGDGKCDCQGAKGCCGKENCCMKGNQGKNCPGHGQANGCGKGNQYRNCMRSCQQTSQPSAPGK
jgi:hypothetical protein